MSLVTKKMTKLILFNPHQYEVDKSIASYCHFYSRNLYE